MSTSRTIILGLMVCGILPTSSIAQEDPPTSIPLSIDGKPATSGCLSIGDSPIKKSDIWTSPMLRELSGIAAKFDARSLAKIRRALGDPVSVDQEHTLVAHLTLSRGDSFESLKLLRLVNGTLALQQPEGGLHAFPIDEDTWNNLEMNHAMLEGILPASIDQLNSHPSAFVNYSSDITLDLRTIRARFKHSYPALTRDPINEKYEIRFPSSQDSSSPPGVLIWISPTPNGRIPDILIQACNELNLIAIGVHNNGNTRELTDRLQNHLDSLATVASYVRIDDRRVYVTGMSGGGRCSSILQLAFPDVFMGAVPIVGLDSYHNTPTGNPGEHWPSRLGRPDGRRFKMLKNRRFAAITGTMDFNEPEMTTRSAQMRSDKLNIRLDVIEGMGHTMPSSEQFLNALRWVDELQLKRIDEAASKAQKSLENARKRFGDALGTDPRSRKVLIEISIDAPWSEPAWEAARLLGIDIED